MLNNFNQNLLNLQDIHNLINKEAELDKIPILVLLNKTDLVQDKELIEDL